MKIKIFERGLKKILGKTYYRKEPTFLMLNPLSTMGLPPPNKEIQRRTRKVKRL
jgi:hypothetical protein